MRRWSIRSLIGAEPGRAAAASRRRSLIAQADTARDRRQFDEAARLYRQVTELAPDNIGMQVQYGHALKEAGRYADAEAAYRGARDARPDDSDIALQLGHFYKLLDRLDDAEQSYKAALSLRPDWSEAGRELEAIARHRALWSGEPRPTRTQLVIARLAPMGLRPAALPEPPSLHIHRLGMWEDFGGERHRTLRGIAALRGYFVAASPIEELRVSLGEIRLYTGAVATNIALKPNSGNGADAFKAVFNVWIDCSELPRRPGTIVLRFVDQGGVIHTHSAAVVVIDPLDEAAYPDSDAAVSLDAADGRSIEDRIRARPSMVREARRSAFPAGLQSVLVMRTDQLGDMVASIPALKRLRALAPLARIVGLVTSANIDFAKTLDLFDELIEVDFPDVPGERRRVMPIEAQRRLRGRLQPYAFDVAIDLAPSHVSRELLLLSGARFLHGFGGGGDWPWLDGRLEFNTPDPIDERDTAPHSTKMLALVEALGTLVRPLGETMRRPDLHRSVLEAYDIGSQARFAVLHLGARLTFSRWPHFAALAARLLRETDLIVVVMDPDQQGKALPAELVAHPRIRLLTERLPFDHLDAFLSYAAVMIGNDSGPKHLASLRGTPTITLFTARIHWGEWGQENTGVIISRRVPCAGCAIFHDLDECGKDFACIRGISVDEVLRSAMRYI